jgi:hypothetical protein
VLVDVEERLPRVGISPKASDEAAEEPVVGFLECVNASWFGDKRQPHGASTTPEPKETKTFSETSGFVV